MLSDVARIDAARCQMLADASNTNTNASTNTSTNANKIPTLTRIPIRGCSTGKSFRFVRACVRAVWLPSGIGSQCVWATLFPFPVLPGGAFPFPFWTWGAFPFPFPHLPNLLSNFSWAYRYMESINTRELRHSHVSIFRSTKGIP